MRASCSTSGDGYGCGAPSGPGGGGKGGPEKPRGKPLARGEGRPEVPSLSPPPRPEVSRRPQAVLLERVARAFLGWESVGIII
jgi:hypothetical protein